MEAKAEAAEKAKAAEKVEPEPEPAAAETVVEAEEAEANDVALAWIGPLLGCGGCSATDRLFCRWFWNQTCTCSD